MPVASSPSFVRMSRRRAYSELRVNERRKKEWFRRDSSFQTGRAFSYRSTSWRSLPSKNAQTQV